jgi:hypothetical protein
MEKMGSIIMVLEGEEHEFKFKFTHCVMAQDREVRPKYGPEGKMEDYVFTGRKQVQLKLSNGGPYVKGGFPHISADDAKLLWVKPESAVDHPQHYNQGKFEVIDVIDDWHLGFALGNCIKYIARAAHKGKELEDLKKALWYLEHHIKSLEK